MSDWACGACGNTNPEGTRFCGHCGAAASDGDANVTSALRSFVAGAVADRLVEGGGRMPEEQRLITALFADISGFTSLADRLDPEQLLEVIDPVIAELSSIVGRYEGYVDKFAGDALLALFGAPVAHDDDAVRALLVAEEMHARLAELSPQLPHQPELTLHIGVNSGHGIARILGSEARMDYAVLGDSVILAQRLESAAPTGETYVSELTVRLTEDVFEFAPVGELMLKGKAEPVPAWRLIGKRRDDSNLQSSPMIGRASELAQVVSALPTDGRGSVITLVGEAGVGKSRLVDATKAAASEQGVGWLETRCLSYGAALAYWPLVDLLRRVGATDADPHFARLTDAGNPTEVADLEPEAFRTGLHAAFRRWFEDLALESPTVLVIEDVHWIDPSTLALLGELVEVTREAPLTLCLVARPEAAERLAGLAAAALSHSSVELEALDADGVASLVTATLGGPAPEELEAFVTVRSAGNPLFVRELTRALVDSGALVDVGGAWRITPGWDARSLPPTVEGAIAARIDLLPRPTAAVLVTASVIGRRVGLPLLEDVVDADHVADAVEELISGGFLERLSDARVAFHHALVQDVAYSRLLRRRRREVHLRVAEAAEARYGAGDNTIDLLARHLYLGRGARAVDYLVRAGNRAKSLYANDEAILHFGRAAELAPVDVTHRLELADLHELVGDYVRALELYDELRAEVADVRAWSGAASTLRKRGRYEEALQVVDDAFASEGLRDLDLTPLWVEQGWTLSVAGRLEQAIDVLTAGLEAAPARDTPGAGQLLFQLARAEKLSGRAEAALTHASEAQAIFERENDLRHLATALRISGDAYLALGRLDEAAAALARGLEIAERVGNAEEVGGCLLNLGAVEHERGNFEAAASYHRRAMEVFERIDHATGRTQATANLAWALAEGGQHEEALAWCGRALELARTFDHAASVADVTDTIASIHLAKGEYAEAERRAEEAAALYLAMSAIPQAARSLDIAAEACARWGEEERARAIRQRARSLVAV